MKKVSVALVGLLALSACQTTGGGLAEGYTMKETLTNPDGSCHKSIENSKDKYVTGESFDGKKFCFAYESEEGDVRSDNILFFYHGANNSFKPSDRTFRSVTNRLYSSVNSHHAYAIMSGGHWTSDGRKSTGGEYDCGFNRPGTCVPCVMVEAMADAQGRILEMNHPDFMHIINVGHSLGGTTVESIHGMQDRLKYQINRTISLAGPPSGYVYEKTQRRYGRMTVKHGMSLFPDDHDDIVEGIVKSEGELIRIVGSEDNAVIPSTVIDSSKKFELKGKSVPTYVLDGKGHRIRDLAGSAKFFSTVMSPFQDGQSQYAYRHRPYPNTTIVDKQTPPSNVTKVGFQQ
jgi:hypothetical protein